VPVNRTEEEIADRWDLATRRAVYDDKPKPPAGNAAVKPNGADIPKLTPAYEEVAERIAAALEKIATRVEMLTGAVLELAEKDANPMMTLSREPASDNWERMLGLLQQLVDNYKIAYQPCVTPEKEMTGSSRKKGNSARKRGGTSAGSTQ